MTEALTLLAEKRKVCGVEDINKFMFGRPNCTSYYRGQDCLRLFSTQCGARNPENLRSTKLRKHIATLSQVLNLKNNELDALADFLGHDIRVHRDFYRMPDATIQLAKISKLLRSMESGNISNLQGKSLDEIEIEGKRKQPHLVTEDTRISYEEPKVAPVKKPCQEKSLRRPWSKNEISAVMRHFNNHILKGKLASVIECKQCCLAEEPILNNRTVQNIRDFVRNKGTTYRRQNV